MLGTLALALLASCSSSGSATPPPHPQLAPTFHTSCTAVDDSSTVVPIQLIAKRDAALIFAGVCINGLGPYSFLVDTGAELSLIDSTVARAITFAYRTPPAQGLSFGCRVTEYLAQMHSWSIGPRSLTPGPVIVGPLKSPELPGVDGIIGSDVLSSFGAVRFDFVHRTLTVQRNQTAPTKDVTGQTGRATAAAGLTGGTTASVAMDVQVQRPPSDPDLDQPVVAVRPTVPVSIGSTNSLFVLDTGAQRSVVSPRVVSGAGLSQAGPKTFTYAGLACKTDVTPYAVTTWKVGGIALGPQTVGSNALGGAVNGLFGSGTLQYLSPVVVDFRDGVLLLGRFTPPS